MSYSEYFDLFYKAQSKQCPYRAFTFDVKNSKNQQQYIQEHDKFLDCILDVCNLLKQEELVTNKKILINDNLNHVFTTCGQQKTNNNQLVLNIF